MTDHPAPESLALFHRGLLEEQELHAVGMHLEACISCSDALVAQSPAGAGRSWRIALGTEPEDESCAVIERLIAPTVSQSDEAWLKNHLAECEECSREVEALRRIAKPKKDTLLGRWDAERARNRWTAVLATAAAATIVAGALVVGRGSQIETVTPPVRVAPSTTIHEPARTDDETIRDGARTYTAAPDGSIHGLSRELEDVARDVRLGRIDFAARIGLAGPREHTRGDDVAPGGPVVLAPVAEVIEDVRPTFRWRPTDAATAHVQVFDERYTPVLESEPVEGDHWRASRALRRGATYSWQITLRGSDGAETVAPAPPQPQARFRILDAETAAAIAASRRTGAHLETGLRLADAGLTGEAARELALASRANPASHAVRELAEAMRRSDAHLRGTH